MSDTIIYDTVGAVELETNPQGFSDFTRINLPRSGKVVPESSPYR